MACNCPPRSHAPRARAQGTALDEDEEGDGPNVVPLTYGVLITHAQRQKKNLYLPTMSDRENVLKLQLGHFDPVTDKLV